SPGTAPPLKSPRTDPLSPTMQTPDAREGHSETDKQEMQTENTEVPPSSSVSPTARRKSWRRATITRRSLPALPNPYQLCRSISKSLSQQERLEKLMEASMRLQAESESWEALLKKHWSKTEELEKMERGQERGLSLDTACVAQSTQYLFIQNKPDYHGLLCRQQPFLHTIAMIMDTQCKMVGELLSIKEQSQLLVKETSGRLAEAGFQDLSPDPIRNLMAVPLSSATT
uniref:DSN1 component of MIS12 kinetochore complex n=1 Tax=Seriola lalandi dorsalis TaxID=1841481 RepID=A0A3B4WF84_SERLL